MLTYTLKKGPGMPLYEVLYRAIRGDILSGRLPAGQKLPSKRALATHLEISTVTVEAAYDQLLAEGYIRAAERVGYFVEAVARPLAQPRPIPEPPAEPPALIDLTANGSTDFPFSTWSRLQRQVMASLPRELLQPLPNRGLYALRQAIADHLAAFRGMQVDPANILVGAGTDFLYNLLIQLLGRDKCYGVEEPGYSKIRRIYDAGGVTCVSAPMDGLGVVPEALGQTQVLHISPAHHFPTGLVTPLSRRQALLQWAAAEADRYIIEDDYDSEFRFDGHPMPTLASLDGQGRVIYMNTFSKTLTPSIRVGFVVLPEGLMAQFQRRLGFYSCTVPSFEQYTLARFLADGHFETHLNRMRKAYRLRRNALLALVRPLSGLITVEEQDAGLHFLARVSTTLSDEALKARCLQAGIRVSCLSDYYHGPVPREALGCLVVNYSSLDGPGFDRLKAILESYPLHFFNKSV